MESKQFNIQEGFSIPYYEDQHKSLSQKLRKIKNTILFQIAYRCPLNSLRILFHRWRGVHIGKNVYIGMHCSLDNYLPNLIYMEDFSNINAETMILVHYNPSKEFSSIFQARAEPVLIKKGAEVSVRCTIMPGVEIGEYAVVSAGSIVEKSVPAYTLVKGNPAKKVLNFEHLMKS